MQRGKGTGLGWDGDAGQAGGGGDVMGQYVKVEADGWSY